MQVQRWRWTGGAAVYRNQVENFVYFDKYFDPNAGCNLALLYRVFF